MHQVLIFFGIASLGFLGFIQTTYIEEKLEITPNNTLYNVLNTNGTTHMRNNLEVAPKNTLHHGQNTNDTTHVRDELEITPNNTLYIELKTNDTTHMRNNLEVAPNNTLHHGQNTNDTTHVRDNLEMTPNNTLHHGQNTNDTTHVRDELKITPNIILYKGLNTNSTTNIRDELEAKSSTTLTDTQCTNETKLLSHHQARKLALSMTSGALLLSHVYRFESKDRLEAQVQRFCQRVYPRVKNNSNAWIANQTTCLGELQVEKDILTLKGNMVKFDYICGNQNKTIDEIWMREESLLPRCKNVSSICNRKANLEN